MTKDGRRPPKPKHSAMKNNGIGDCYANLAAAIIEQACADYVNTPSGVFERTKRDCERFFRSDWFVLLSGGAVDAEKALSALREQRRQRLERERERKRMERERRKEREGGGRMTATDELRRLLDERGAEWREHEAPATDCIAFFDGNGWHDCWESVDGEVNVTFSMNPEQAVEATLGRGTCHAVFEVDAMSEDERVGEYVCSECGETFGDGRDQWPRYCSNCGRRVVE